MDPSAAPSNPSRRPQVARGLGALADRYDLILCDLWGVVHDGRRALPEAVRALARYRAVGGTVVFITNAPRPAEPVRAQITTLGVTPDAYDGLVSSGDVTIAAIAEAGDKALHFIGPERDFALLSALERATGRAPRLTDIAGAELVVVTDLRNNEVETPADYVDQLAVMRARELPMICANPDIVVHVGEQLIYCGGALAEAYAALGGSTLLAGKPHAPIYEAAIALGERARGASVDRARILAIGDGMVTDGAGAARQGLDLLFITSGIHREEFHPAPEEVLDEGRYVDRLLALAFPPMAALPALVW